jgi:molybdenum cofactor cytidylyltransferase
MGSSNKLFLDYRGHTIIEEVLEQLSNSSADNILIVTGHENKRIERLLDGYRSDRVDFIFNHNYRLGRAESIKCAVEWIRGEADAALFMVADKPEVTSTLINRALDRFREDQPSLLYVETPSGRGHPVIFSKELYDELMLLEGDRVGNELISRYASETVRLIDTVPQRDINTEDDYRVLIKNESGKISS